MVAVRSTHGRAVAVSPWLLGAGLSAAVVLRGAVGGADPPSSIPAAAVFASALFALALAAGWRPSRPSTSALLIGVAGGAVLIALSLASRPVVVLGAGGAGALAFAPVVAVAVTAEEALVRGALFSALMSRWGAVVAVVLTSLVFALVHLPIYGVTALPLDLAVGLWLGGLRLLTGGIAAPTVAHLLADLSPGWLG